MRRSNHLTLRVMATGLVTAGLVACDLFGPSGSGVLVARVLSPYGADGAVVLELEGGVGLGPVTSDVGDVFFRHDEHRSRIVVVMDTPGQVEFTVRTTDIGEIPSVSVVQVADAANQLRASVEGYLVEFEQFEDFSSKLQRRVP